MTDLIWSERSRADLFAIADHYDAIEPGLGDRMLARIADAPLVLIEHPRVGVAVGARGLRKWQAKGTPFLLLYRVRRDGAVEVASVRHERENWRPA